MNLDYESDPRIVIRLQAGIDLVNQEAFWLFEALDKQIGVRPLDPSVGILPPKNESLNVGEGYVGYSIKAEKYALHLAEIEALAEIIFDENEPIITPKIINTIDDTRPEAILIFDSELMKQGQLGVRINKFDNGSGANSVNIYQKISDQYILISESITDDFYVLPIKVKGEYNFSLLINDNVGNTNDLRGVKDYKVNFNFNLSCTNNCSGNGICVNNVCKCNPSFTYIDCSIKSVDILNSTELSLNYSSNLTEGKSFSLTFKTSRPLNQTFSFKSIVNGFPNQTYFVKNLQNFSSIVILNSIETYEVFLPSYFSGSILLQAMTYINYYGNDLVKNQLFEIKIKPVANTPTFKALNKYCLNSLNKTVSINFEISTPDNDGSEQLGIELMNYTKIYSINLNTKFNNGTIVLFDYDLAFNASIKVTSTEILNNEKAVQLVPIKCGVCI